MRTAFITGCATGFGHGLARRLLRDGYRVIATDRSAPVAWASTLPGSERLLTLQLDVRDPRSVHQAVEAALAWSPVDILVNNAGYAVFGSIEETPMAEVQELFEVNVFGLARVTQALLPSLRARGGTVVQLSSVAGRTVFPESGYYAASKYAVEAMSEALFQETCRFGVRLRLVEPGSFDTCFQQRAAEVSPEMGPDSPYASLRPRWGQRKDEVLEPPQDPGLVVDAIARSLDDPRPFLRIPVGPDSKRILEVRDALGADGWSLLAGVRAGLDSAHLPEGLLSVPEVLERWSDPTAPIPPEIAEDLRLTAQIAAQRHLGHWAESPEGRLALAVLARVERVIPQEPVARREPGARASEGPGER